MIEHPDVSRLRNLDHLVGSDAPQAFRGIIECLPDVATVSAFTYTAPVSLQQRANLTAGEAAIVQTALSVRERYALPFWDAVMLSCFDAATEVTNLLDASMMHRRHTPVPMTRVALLDGALARLCDSSRDEMVAVTSQVTLVDGTLRHIPLLDFHCPISDRARAVVAAVARRLLPDGAILLESGQSYHVYGRRLLDVDEFLDFLARAILFAPIIDRAYCAHKWLERMSALRVSSGGRTKMIPRVVAVLERSAQNR